GANSMARCCCETSSTESGSRMEPRSTPRDHADLIHNSCAYPPLPSGLTYVRVLAGDGHSLAVRSDGTIVMWGANNYGQLNVPTFPAGTSVVSLATGYAHSVAVLSDGSTVGWGLPAYSATGIPTLTAQQIANGVGFADVAVGANHLLALYTDGRVVGFGFNNDGQLNVPPLPVGVRYTHVTVGWWHSMALRSDGLIAAWGWSYGGLTNPPPLPPNTRYERIASSTTHNVALRSDGVAVAFGNNAYGMSTLPPPPVGQTYIDIDAGERDTLLLRSDGTIAVIGDQSQGLGNVPPLPPGVRYTDLAASENCHWALRSDGQVVVWPPLVNPTLPLPAGVYYVEVDADRTYAAMRRSDGQVVELHSATPLLPLGLPKTQLPPGQSYVGISSDLYRVVGRVGPTSTYIRIAPGCAGTLQPARMVPRDTPRIGKDHIVTVFDLPQNLALLAMGWQQLPGPVSLAGIGMPNCNLNISIDGVVLLAGQNGSAEWRLPIPDVPSLVGVHFYNQALVLDAAGNPFGAVVSDAAEGVVGGW
ncbi:MAG: hypothetical protein WBO45_11945, partial [Planctomycetota bacterium]